MTRKCFITLSFMVPIYHSIAGWRNSRLAIIYQSGHIMFASPSQPSCDTQTISIAPILADLPFTFEPYDVYFYTDNGFHGGCHKVSWRIANFPRVFLPSFVDVGGKV